MLRGAVTGPAEAGSTRELVFPLLSKPSRVKRFSSGLVQSSGSGMGELSLPFVFLGAARPNESAALLHLQLSRGWQTWRRWMILPSGIINQNQHQRQHLSLFLLYLPFYLVSDARGGGPASPT